ncbi:hypothetical protein LTR91_016908 [Friedmanniomyces endolithicus]|uniref:Uncharacterized protein n=1 Tax=Friedmanniomyces endolithicus TaxID=329885 RepID=A0AAN6K749_9PEZI|nr:hypothetical protein LTR38_015588 [Friedmanniomyces endolithicus]KAK0778634.1 hypothetical protein LTR75_015605 [Friedmanniomyces endolithicus]KAK0807399.1 hypothetical protein LTR59_003242 [Friedmanniomyces endolithicus]KAK0831977.1 hypothetical protein LTR03_015273 [Friedmanniomyces endolithicus]KAK0847073.1 hypothetical protein LTS02_014631 [Friedmanniomyces endolithicus]
MEVQEQTEQHHLDDAPGEDVNGVAADKILQACDIECERLDSGYIYDEQLRLVNTFAAAAMNSWVTSQVVLPLTAENVSVGSGRVSVANDVNLTQVTGNAADTGAIF